MQTTLAARVCVALLAVLVSPSCSDEPTPPASAFLVRAGPTGFSIVDRNDPGRVLLESYAGTAPAPYTPLAVRRASATWEMSFGSFRVTEGLEPWTEGRAARATGSSEQGPFAWTDGLGATVASVEVSEPAEGVLVLTVRATNPKANRVSLAFACAAGDRFLGFGAQADALDHRGHKVPIWTSEPGIGKSSSDDPPDLWMLEGARHASSMGLPTWLSPRGYLGVVESDRRSVFELCSAREDAWRVETWGRELKLHLYYGPTPAKALERATAGVLGRPMRPPPLAFAPWMDAVHGSDNVRAVARLIREKGIPSSAIWTEDFRGGYDAPSGYRLEEEWDTDRTLYPDVEKLGAELRAQGFAWFAYFNTFLVQDTRVFAEAERDGHFVRAPAGGPYLYDGVTFKPSGMADLSRPATREWVKGYLRKALDDGFDGWMADYGEWLPHDAVLDSGEDPQEAHNRYAHEWVKLNREVLAEREADGRQRLFFARAGWLGSTAQVPVYWAGDQRTSFQADDGLPTVIPIGLNLGLAGVSTFGHDIAGYQSATNPPSTKELFFRWTTLGALSPVMRTHHGIDARANWNFAKDEETLAHFRRWADFHLRLFPYLDGSSAIAETTGLPIMRALPLEFPAFDAGWAAADQYLLGPSLLVAPIMEEGRTARRVRLPPGRWIPLEGGEPLEGPGEVELTASQSEIIVLLRASGIVPLLPAGVQTLLPADAPVVDLDDVKDRRELLVFASAADSSFEERDGSQYGVGPGSAPGDGFFVAGQKLPDCVGDARGCVATPRADGAARVRLTSGTSRLEFGDRAVIINGPPREIDVVLRR